MDVVPAGPLFYHFPTLYIKLFAENARARATTQKAKYRVCACRLFFSRRESIQSSLHPMCKAQSALDRERERGGEGGRE